MVEVNRATKNTVMETGEKVFDFKVIAGDYSDPTKMGYSWKAVAFDERSLDLQIYFDNPNFVSMEEDPEYVRVIIRDGSIFVSEDGLPLELAEDPDSRRLLAKSNFELSKEPLILSKKIPVQKPSGETEKLVAQALEIAATGSQMVFLGNFAFNLALSASLNQLWSMINTQ